MLAYLLIATGFLARFLPFGHNMAPIAAIALFSGAYLNKKIVPWVPLVIMVSTDMILGLHDVVLFTWTAFILIGFMGMALKRKRTPLSVFGMTLAASLLFFAISNFGVWLVWYPRTGSGVVNCYVMALPFLRNSLAGNMVFSAVLFGVYEMSMKMAGQSRYKDLLFAR